MVSRYTDVAKANIESLGREAGEYSAGFSDFIAMKVLAAKRVSRFGNAYGANAAVLAFKERKELVRNLGIRIDALRLAELDALTELLGCNKQEFVLEVLVSGIEQTKEAIESAGLTGDYEELVNAKVEQAGFSVVPARTEGFWTLQYKGEVARIHDHEKYQKAVSAMSDLINEDLGGEVASEN